MTTPLPPVRRVARLALLLGGLVLLTSAGWVALAPGVREPVAVAPAPLAGRTVVLDAGHQLGNGAFPGEVGALVDAGGFEKPCNTVGSATDGGYPEATFTWQVTRLVQRRLEELGARVVLTRSANRDDRWGPCVDARGRAGNSVGSGGRADVKLSIHGDGCDGCGAGFHVIAPRSRVGWTDDIAVPSLAFAQQLHASLRAAGLLPAPYIAGADGLDVRGDLGTFNWSDVPVAMVELGNMRDPHDAAWMQDGRGRARIAEALVAAVVAYLR